MITIGDGIPTDGNIRANAHALARYAALCQEAGIVPIVEPEVLMDADNTLEECWEVTTRTLHETFDALYEEGLDLQGLLLKPNMVISGKGCAATGDLRTRSRRRPSTASSESFRLPCPGSCSCPEASPRFRRRRT